MISILVWNIRGVANCPSIRRIKQIMKKQKVALVAILEPKSSIMSITDLQRKLQCDGSITNIAGTIWVLWKAQYNCTEVSNEDQQITLSVCFNSTQFHITCVYASTNADVRKHLWTSLLQPRTAC